MSDGGMFRARLNGLIIEDTTDTTSPAGARQAIVTAVREDTGTGTSAQVLVKALAWLPNNVPCPAYAANLHYFDLVAGPASVPVARAVQPRVTIRRDATADAGTTSCYSVILNPTLICKANTVWASGTSDAIHRNTMVDLTFYDQQNNTRVTQLGYFGEYGGVGEMTCDIIQPGGLCQVTGRTSVVGNSLPGGWSYAWIVSPLNQGNTCPCKITSGGPGASYVASFYANGPANPATETSVPVVQLMIDGGETIPVDTWVIATRVLGQWYIQAPVWLA